MNTYIDMRGPTFDEVWNHLLLNPQKESAAFLYAQPMPEGKNLNFKVVGHMLAQPEHCARQEADYLELTDEARISLIKTAHRLNASIIEMHSHTGPWPAAFSLTDWHGLKATVPHMWWRLPEKPYLALVVCQSGFDALVWMDNPDIPIPLTGLNVGNKQYLPTHLSFTNWRHYGKAL